MFSRSVWRHPHVQQNLRCSLSTSTASLATSIAGVPLQGCLVTTPNPQATTVDHLRELTSVSTGAVTTRTVCPGFEHDDAVHQWKAWGRTTDRSSTINCLGYSSETHEVNLEAIKQLRAEGITKPFIVSITGTAEQVVAMVQDICNLEDNSDLLIEINLSCPNIPCKPPISYDFDGMDEYLTTILQGKPDTSPPIGVKITPYFYEQQFEGATQTLNALAPNLSFVTTINTVGNGLWVDIESESAVLPGDGYGGLGGAAVHATALANVRQLRTRLDSSIDIIGVGGVSTGEDAFRHMLCGASAVGMASAVLTEGPGIVDRVEAELKSIMESKGYSCLDDFKAKLKAQQ